MLEGLDRVNWKQLEHAYGEAENVPELIRALAADDETVRERALSSLWGNIIHQGTVYSATAFAVPFLVELLGSPAVKNKPSLLRLVTSLACGHSYLDAHQNLFEDIPAFQEDMQKPAWHEQLQKELGWVQAAYDAVGQGYATYVELLASEDAETRWCAAYTLAVCGSHAEECVLRMRERLAEEADDRVKASILLGLGCLGGEDCGPVFDAWLKTGTQPGSRVDAPGVRAAAALSMARVCRDRTPREAIEVLADCLQNPGPVDELYLELLWSSGESVISAAGQALSLLGREAAATVVPRIADGLRHLAERDSGSIALVGTLLGLVFEPQKEPRTAAGLTDLQRSVLTTLVESDRAWDYGNVCFTLHQFGLPMERQEMAELLGGEK